jgi:hypothetical protein
MNLKALEAFKELPDHTWLNSREVAAIYDIVPDAAIRAGKRGTLPPPFTREDTKSSRPYLWRLGDIREHVKAGCPHLSSGRRTAYNSEAEDARRGKVLAEYLGLRASGGYDPPRYLLAGETRTALGVYRVLKRIIETGE